MRTAIACACDSPMLRLQQPNNISVAASTVKQGCANVVNGDETLRLARGQGAMFLIDWYHMSEP